MTSLALFASLKANTYTWGDWKYSVIYKRDSIHIPSLIPQTHCMKTKVQLISLLQSISLKLLNIQCTNSWSFVAAAIFIKRKKEIFASK